MNDEATPARKALHLTPDQLRMAYGALLNHPEPFLRRLASTRLETLDRSPLDTTPDASTLHASESL